MQSQECDEHAVVDKRDNKASQKSLSGQDEQSFALRAGKKAEREPDDRLDEHVQSPGRIDSVHQESEQETTYGSPLAPLSHTQPRNEQQHSIWIRTPEGDPTKHEPLSKKDAQAGQDDAQECRHGVGKERMTGTAGQPLRDRPIYEAGVRIPRAITRPEGFLEPAQNGVVRRLSREYLARITTLARIMAERKKRSGGRRKNQRSRNKQGVMVFERKNYLLMVLGVVLVVAGYVIMRMENEVDGFISLYVAPLMILGGYLEIIWAIMWRPKGESTSAA